MIAIIDYGMGNLRSVQKAFEILGYNAEIVQKPEELKKFKALVLPGVGAFPDAMKNLRSKNFDLALKEEIEGGKYFLGICLGMQLLFKESSEGTFTEGLKILDGSIVELPKGLKVPHVGWNSLEIIKEIPLLDGLRSGEYVYFVHSYYAKNFNEKFLCAFTEYSVKVPAVFWKDNIYACQFHPEKSGEVGLKILKNFAEMVI